MLAPSRSLLRLVSAQLLRSSLSRVSCTAEEQPASFVELALSAASVADTFGMTLLFSDLNFSAPSTQSLLLFGHLQRSFAQPSKVPIVMRELRIAANIMGLLIQGCVFGHLQAWRRASLLNVC